MDDFLARAVFHELGLRVAQVHSLAEQLHGLAQRSRRFGFHQRAEFGGDFVHGIRAQTQGHALPGTQRVDGDGKRKHRAVHGRLLDKQRLAAAGRFHFAVGEFGDFEFGGDGLRDAFEFTRALKCGDELAEGIESHAHSVSKRVALATLRLGARRVIFAQVA